MNTNISTDELISFKQDLTLFQEEKISEVLLAPLGEYWSIRFIRAKDGVKIQGNICDKNIISLQHNLTFNWIADLRCNICIPYLTVLQKISSI